MPRAVKLWIGKTDDSKAPPRVRLRVFVRENGICKLSGRKIQPGEIWELDHGVALINGGRNSEDNLYPVLVGPHREKTKADVAEKKRVADRAKSNIGIRKPTLLRGRKFDPPEPRNRSVTKVAHGPSAFARQIVKIEIAGDDR